MFLPMPSDWNFNHKKAFTTPLFVTVTKETNWIEEKKNQNKRRSDQFLLHVFHPKHYKETPSQLRNNIIKKPQRSPFKNFLILLHHSLYDHFTLQYPNQKHRSLRTNRKIHQQHNKISHCRRRCRHRIVIIIAS